MLKYAKQFKDFIFSNATGGSILVVCVCISLVIANTNLAGSFDQLLKTQLGPYKTLSWINDGLMAIFFLLVGLEIKDEALTGELSSLKHATLPIFAALGGMLVPALIYFTINYNTTTAHGWGIPMATDIAFVIAVINVIKAKVPVTLQIFIKALAIVDDLGAIVVIALFYSAGLNSENLLYAVSIFLFQLILNRLKVKQLWAYLIPGVALWYFVHHSGIHATVAGVLTAMAIPDKVKANYSPLKRLIHFLENPVNFIIVPLFALANSNIQLFGERTGVLSTLAVGIFAGLFLGKPVGITLFSWIAVKLKLSKLGNNVKWNQVWGIGQLAGIGFTMSIFISLLSFNEVQQQNLAKISILVASVMAAISGYLVLRSIKKPTL